MPPRACDRIEAGEGAPENGGSEGGALVCNDEPSAELTLLADLRLAGGSSRDSSMTSRITGDSKTPSTASIIRASGADPDDRQGAREPRTRPAVEPMVQGDRGRGHREAFQAGGRRGMDARDTADPGGVLSRALFSRDGDPVCASGDNAQSPAERIRGADSSLRASVGGGRSVGSGACGIADAARAGEQREAAGACVARLRYTSRERAASSFLAASIRSPALTMW